MPATAMTTNDKNKLPESDRSENWSASKTGRKTLSLNYKSVSEASTNQMSTSEDRGHCKAVPQEEKKQTVTESPDALIDPEEVHFIGPKLKRLREQAGLTPEELAKLSGVKLVDYLSFESGAERTERYIPYKLSKKIRPVLLDHGVKSSDQLMLMHHTERYKTMREEAGLSVRDVAQLLGYEGTYENSSTKGNPSSAQHWELRKRHVKEQYGLGTPQKLAKILLDKGVPEDDVATIIPKAEIISVLRDIVPLIDRNDPVIIRLNSVLPMRKLSGTVDIDQGILVPVLSHGAVIRLAGDNSVTGTFAAKLPTAECIDAWEQDGSIVGYERTDSDQAVPYGFFIRVPTNDHSRWMTRGDKVEVDRAITELKHDLHYLIVQGENLYIGRYDSKFDSQFGVIVMEAKIPEGEPDTSRVRKRHETVVPINVATVVVGKLSRLVVSKPLP